MKLIFGKVKLRYIRLDDASWLLKEITRPEITSTIGGTHIKSLTLEKERIWINNQPNLRRKKEEIHFIITDRNTKEKVGVCGFHTIKLNEKYGDIGAWVAKKYWKQGYATDACNILLHYGFNDLKLHRIEGMCFTNNSASFKLMEKLGFKREGLLRDRMIYKGKPHDAYIYSILKHEWEKAYKSISNKNNIRRTENGGRKTTSI